MSGYDNITNIFSDIFLEVFSTNRILIYITVTIEHGTKNVFRIVAVI